MLSKSKIKLIKSLEYKKYRMSNGLFLAEGNKLITDLLHAQFPVKSLIGTREFLEEIRHLIPESMEITVSTSDEIKSASLLKQPQSAMALCPVPDNRDMSDPANNLVICLDNIQDPGNLGTIIRIADWFGIEDVVCSDGSADIYNPKAVQASMGSICRVRVSYTALPGYLSAAASNAFFIGGAFMEGENIYRTDIPQTGILVMGNEGRGISGDIAPLITKRLSVPSFSRNSNRADSLKVAVATSLICSEFRRRSLL